MKLYTLKAIEVLMGFWGGLFCFQWMASQLLFPILKDRLTGYLPFVAGIILGSLFLVPAIKKTLNSALINSSSRSFLLAVFAAAFSLRIIAIMWFPSDPIGDHAMFHGSAVSLLNGDGYGNVGYRALYPPGMSFLLAGWYGATIKNPIAGEVLNAVISSGLVLLVYRVSKRVLGDLAARWAGVLSAIMPTMVFYSATLGYEIVLSFIFMAVVDRGIAVVDAEKRGWISAVIIGLLLGAGSLVKPVCVPIAFLLCGWWLLMGLGRRALVYSAITVVVMIAVITPWTIRNYRVFGEFVPISTNGGGVLYNANNSDSAGLYMVVKSLPGEYDEVSTDRIRFKAAVKWIRENPSRWARLALDKAIYTWGTSSTIMSFISYDRMPVWQENVFMAVLNTFWASLLTWCIAATLSGEIWRNRFFYLGYLLLAYIFLVHLFFEALSRHQIPVIAVLILVAVPALVDETVREN